MRQLNQQELSQVTGGASGGLPYIGPGEGGSTGGEPGSGGKNNNGYGNGAESGPPPGHSGDHNPQLIGPNLGPRGVR